MIAYGASITEIYFFGAGCSSPDRHEIVSNALSQLFPKAYISIDSDLLGSAYATCGHEKGLCCVLGTGSNISFLMAMKYTPASTVWGMFWAMKGRAPGLAKL